MTLERCRRILCCGVRQENGRWPRRFQALLKDATTTGRLQRLLPGATSASRFGGAFEEGARVPGAVACFVRFSKSTTTARPVAVARIRLGTGPALCVRLLRAALRLGLPSRPHWQGIRGRPVRPRYYRGQGDIDEPGPEQPVPRPQRGGNHRTVRADAR